MWWSKEKREAVSQYSCMTAAAAAIIFGLLPYLGVKPAEHPKEVGLFPLLSLLAAIICGLLFYLGKRLERRESLDAPPPPTVEQRFFICSNGYPLQGLQSAIALHVQILSTVQTKIVFAKATLSRSEGNPSWIDIESYEPHILAPMQMFNLPLTKKDMQQEDVSRFLGPNTLIRGFIKVEKDGGYEEIQIPELATHRECPEVPQLRAKLNEAESKITALSNPPDDLHVKLLCFLRGSILNMTRTMYFFKLSISCDEETGIKDVTVKLIVGGEVFELKPLDLSEFILTTPFKGNPYKKFEDTVMTTVSLWDILQRDGLRSGLLRDGWLGVDIEKLFSLDELPSQIEIQITKSRYRKPTPFVFTTLPACEEGVHVFDRTAREAP